jgi:hypothetical protein
MEMENEMKSDDFEQKLRQQPIRQVPQAWRAEILATASQASRLNVDARPSRGFLSTLNSRLSTLLWPHPKAWAGLAAIWIGILTINFFTADPTGQIARNVSEPSPELMIALQEQRRELARLTESGSAYDLERPRSSPPRPRSELRVEMPGV